MVELPASTRIVIVGDVHACYDELVALLRECAYDAANNDRLVFVGDLVNKGPKPVEVSSLRTQWCQQRKEGIQREGVFTKCMPFGFHSACAQVVRFVRESNALCVRGNHDDAALSKYYEWQANGRVPGSMGAYSYVAHFSREDVQFLEQLPFTLTLPNQNAIIVHGGLVPDASLSVQRPLDMYKMRYLHRVRAHPSGSAAGEEGAWVASEKRDGELEGVQVLWATQWRGPMHVYFGHDASAGLQVKIRTYMHRDVT